MRKSSMKGSLEIFRFILFCLAVAAIGMSLSLPEVDVIKTTFFCSPVTLIIALLTGGEFNLVNGETAILTPGLRLLVTPSCSGISFFLILSASLFWAANEIKNKKWLFLIIPTAYIITIMANTIRIIAVSRWEIYISSQIPLPLPLQHQAIGMMIFLPVLITVYVLSVYHINRISEQKHGRNHTADNN